MCFFLHRSLFLVSPTTRAIVPRDVCAGEKFELPIACGRIWISRTNTRRVMRIRLRHGMWFFRLPNQVTFPAKLAHFYMIIHSNVICQLTKVTRRSTIYTLDVFATKKLRLILMLRLHCFINTYRIYTDIHCISTLYILSRKFWSNY